MKQRWGNLSQMNVGHHSSGGGTNEKEGYLQGTLSFCRIIPDLSPIHFKTP
ncbi:MAG: hypothetical protein JNN12_06885 [Bacteroidetes Order II. Incertae sedis bacterium]|nr:hypothetical protein [Bacteroidetes Order II. bacterium]